MSFENLKNWIGRTEETSDQACVAPLKGLAATLDHAEPPWGSDTVPPLGHWLYFLPQALQRDISEDGHPKRGGFLPPVPLPRRMWAGSRVEFHVPIVAGTPIERLSTISAVEHKSGKSGDLVFVTVEHSISNQGRLALTEVQDIVYKEAPPPGQAAPAAPATSAEARRADWTRTVTPDPVLLFRFSALTFNGHRIHYDRPYALEVECYPGLVVHGPLTATLLMDLFLRHHPGARVLSCSIRGRQPLFDTHPFTLCGNQTENGAEMWALDKDGQVAMTVGVVAQ